MLGPGAWAWVILVTCWYLPASPLANGEPVSVRRLEKPAYNVPLWTPGVGARTNVCHRQMSVQQGNSSLRDALKGLSLSMVFDDYAPYTMINEEGAVTGHHRRNMRSFR